MKMHRVWYTRALPWLFAGVAGALVWADSQPVDAAFTATVGSAVVAVNGVVAGAPESVLFTGQARVDTKAVTDPDFGGPTNVVITIDLSRLSGRGLLTNAAYTTQSKRVLIRPLVPSDQVDFSFPFFPSGAAVAAPARLAKANVVLVYNPLTGALTSGNVLVTAP